MPRSKGEPGTYRGKCGEECKIHDGKRTQNRKRASRLEARVTSYHASVAKMSPAQRAGYHMPGSNNK